MAALTFHLTQAPPERLDLSPLVPARLAGLTVAAIEALAIGTSRQGVAVGDVFRVSGDDAADVVIDGGSERYDFIGRDLAGGAIRVVGDVGAHLGRGVKSGTITVEGSVHGPHGGAGMTGGRIEIGGNAADATAGALPGAMHGMAGGLMVIRGRAKAYLGDRMRRGVIVVHGAVGEAAGCRMIGGTIVAPSAAARAGTGLKRGTLVFGTAEALEPTFVSAGTYDAAFLSLFRRWLAAEAGATAAALVPSLVHRHRGDMSSLGKGEILIGT